MATSGKGKRVAAAALAVIGLGIAGLLLNHAGCQTGRGRARPIELDLLAGHWEGKWISDKGMDGKLVCEVRKVDATHYDADFHAIYAKVLTNDSSVTYTVKKQPDRWEFEGSKDLGLLLGGKYKYKGFVTADEFFSSYDSAFDQGEFRLRRAAATQPATMGKP